MKFLDKIWVGYAAPDEPDWEALRAASSHPELIGRNPSDVVPPPGMDGSDAPMYFLHCGCGMLSGTSKDYSGCEATCMNCAGNTGRPSASASGDRGRMSPHSERQIRLGLIAFVLLAAVMVGVSVSNGGTRPEAPVRVLD